MRLFAGTKKGLFVFEHVGSRLQLVHVAKLGVPVTALLSDRRSGKLFAALGHGHFGAKLHVTTDHAQTLTELPSPKFPPKPEGLVDLDPIRKREIPWTVDMIWSLATGTPSQPGRLWCGTIPGGLFRSDDDGANWTLVDSLWSRSERAHWFGGGYDLPGIHSIVVHPTDGRRVSLAISCGGVWHTDDDAATWSLSCKGMRAGYVPLHQATSELIQDPHRMVGSPVQPDIYWAQHHNGAYRSTDGGHTWSELKVPPSTFGFSVATHPKHADTAWFVPAVSDEVRVAVGGKLVVSRTRDGGQTFEELSNGLPGPHAYHLIYRHALDVIDGGLALGSTTGGLWFSRDEGDSFEEVAMHLPPILCLAFE